MSASPPPKQRLLGHGSWPETARIAEVLRKETVGGALLLAGATIALVWADSRWGDAFLELRNTRVGPESLHLHLTLGTWAADGLLAIFFFVAGLELKREFVAGDLRDPAARSGPGGRGRGRGHRACPALRRGEPHRRRRVRSGPSPRRPTSPSRWRCSRSSARTCLPRCAPLLLTLAVVDDLLAITIIALFYTRHLSLLPLLAAMVPLALFALAVQRGSGICRGCLLPLALVWALVHASGVHATVAGVLLAFVVPVERQGAGGGPASPSSSRSRWRPLSASVAVPVFAFFAAGVAIGGLEGFRESVRDPVAVGVVVGLVVGKPLGVLGRPRPSHASPSAELDSDLSWWDVVGLAILAGIGFTVSLLIGELAFGSGSTTDDHVKVAVLVGSLLAAAFAGGLLRPAATSTRGIEARRAGGLRPRRHPGRLRALRYLARRYAAGPRRRAGGPAAGAVRETATTPTGPTPGR